MQLDDIIASLNTHRPSRPTPGQPEVVLRIAGRAYTVRGMYASTAHVIIEGDEEVASAALSPEHLTAVPGGPEGEGVEPTPPADRQQAGSHDPQATTAAVPRHIARQAAQITPVAESILPSWTTQEGRRAGTRKDRAGEGRALESKGCLLGPPPRGAGGAPRPSRALLSDLAHMGGDAQHARGEHGSAHPVLERWRRVASCLKGPADTRVHGIHVPATPPMCRIRATA